MKTEVEDIERLERAILTEARDAADQIRSEAQAKADGIRKRGQDQAEAERRAILDRAQKDAERLRGQSVATAQLKARSLELTRREQLLDRVFKAATAKLPEVQARPDYDQIAVMLLREALVQLRVKEAELRADERTLKFLEGQPLDDISRELGGNFEVVDPLEEGTGVVVDAAGGKIHYDNTLETRLGRLQGSLRSAVYRILMGEKP
jgi:V/A-type H+-transporting ATPase subunit E